MKMYYSRAQSRQGKRRCSAGAHAANTTRCVVQACKQFERRSLIKFKRVRARACRSFSYLITVEHTARRRAGGVSECDANAPSLHISPQMFNIVSNLEADCVHENICD